MRRLIGRNPVGGGGGERLASGWSDGAETQGKLNVNGIKCGYKVGPEKYGDKVCFGIRKSSTETTGGV